MHVSTVANGRAWLFISLREFKTAPNGQPRSNPPARLISLHCRCGVGHRGARPPFYSPLSAQTVCKTVISGAKAA